MKITPQIEKIVVREKMRAPHLGVRAITRVLQDKYGITLSKSSVHAILVKKNITSKKGRKPAALHYQRQIFNHCELLAIQALDGAFDCFHQFTKQLQICMPKLSEKSLYKIVQLLSFSAYLGQTIEDSVRSKGFLRLVGLSHYPKRNVEYVMQRISNYAPTLSLAPVYEGAALVTTIVFHFRNNTLGFCDASMITFWQGLCERKEFFAPLHMVEKLLQLMQRHQLLMIFCTKSIDYLSSLVTRFIEGLKSGIARIELLGETGAKLRTIIADTSTAAFFAHPEFFVGFYPKALTTGIQVTDYEKHFYAMPKEKDLFHQKADVVFLSRQQGIDFPARVFLIRKQRDSWPCWGVITNVKKNITKKFHKYLVLWPELDLRFNEEIENFAIASALNLNKNHNYDTNKYIIIEKWHDLKKIVSLILQLSKSAVGVSEMQPQRGWWSKRKEVILVSIPGIDSEFKQKINKQYFCIDHHRVLTI